jgi:hypothetical protein
LVKSLESLSFSEESVFNIKPFQIVIMIILMMTTMIIMIMIIVTIIIL